MQGSSSPPYVDTPYGIMTAGGRWYHVTEEEVRDYAGEVLEYVSLDQLLQWADVWVDSSETVVLWTFPLTLWGLPVEWAAGSAILLYVGWALLSPVLPSLLAVRVVTLLDRGLTQALYYVLTMSALAAAGMHAAVVAGLVGFILLRWGVVGWLLGHVVRPLLETLYPLPIADQVLRGLILRVALKHRLSLPQLSEITEDILDNLRGHRGEDSS